MSLAHLGCSAGWCALKAGEVEGEQQAEEHGTQGEEKVPYPRLICKLIVVGRMRQKCLQRAQAPPVDDSAELTGGN